MALTAEDILSQKFAITKFRDGYDLDQVDDFLDLVAQEFTTFESTKAELEQKIAELTEQLEECRASAVESSESDAAETETPEPVAAATAAPAQDDPTSADAVKSSAMLQLALELHDKYVDEGQTKRDELIAEGERNARELVSEAENQRTQVLEDLNTRRLDLQNRINDLRDFEGEYRTTLRSYIEAQLRTLDSSQEPLAKPDSIS